MIRTQWAAILVFMGMKFRRSHGAGNHLWLGGTGSILHAGLAVRW